MESSYETRLNNLETNYESRLRTLGSELESRLRGLEMGYEGRMRGLEKNYESVLVELVGFQRGVAQQDGVLKSLIRCYLGEDSEFFFSFPVTKICEPLVCVSASSRQTKIDIDDGESCSYVYVYSWAFITNCLCFEFR